MNLAQCGSAEPHSEIDLVGSPERSETTPCRCRKGGWELSEGIQRKKGEGKGLIDEFLILSPNSSIKAWSLTLMGALVLRHTVGHPNMEVQG